MLKIISDRCRALTRVDQQKGKFRSFLLASLQKFLSNEAQRANCLKRGGHLEFVHLDLKDAENRYGQEEPVAPAPAKAPTQQEIFDARWAMALLGEGRNRLSREYVAEGKSLTFEALFSGPGCAYTQPAWVNAVEAHGVAAREIIDFKQFICLTVQLMRYRPGTNRNR